MGDYQVGMIAYFFTSLIFMITANIYADKYYDLKKKIAREKEEKQNGQ